MRDDRPKPGLDQPGFDMEQVALAKFGKIARKAIDCAHLCRIDLVVTQETPAGGFEFFIVVGNGKMLDDVTLPRFDVTPESLGESNTHIHDPSLQN